MSREEHAKPYRYRWVELVFVHVELHNVVRAPTRVIEELLVRAEREEHERGGQLAAAACAVNELCCRK